MVVLTKNSLFQPIIWVALQSLTNWIGKPAFFLGAIYYFRRIAIKSLWRTTFQFVKQIFNLILILDEMWTNNR